ncbi:hypothetical protein GGF42_005897 [Coemansia sp. RSA 2424]|nr:hypothetical protein GGF42_005897 [Coemansia sp. RSA 2424]
MTGYIFLFIVLVTNSISRLVEVDGDDLINTPLLRLVAPESLARTAQFLEDLPLTDGRGQLFADPSRLQGGGSRVEVEMAGAHSDDGAVLLCRRVRVCSQGDVAMALEANTKRRDKVPESDGGYLSLSDLLSSDLETSDCLSTWSNNTLAQGV